MDKILDRQRIISTSDHLVYHPIRENVSTGPFWAFLRFLPSITFPCGSTRGWVEVPVLSLG